MKYFSLFLFLLLIGFGIQVRAETDPDVKEDNQVFYSCEVDSDCEVMNIGSCCGYNPACVNKESRPDPDAVSKECMDSGLSGACGFIEIEECLCDKGTCKAATPMSGVENF